MLIFFDIVTFRTQSKKIIREGRNIYNILIAALL